VSLTAELLGERVRAALADAGVTQQALADRIGMDPTALSKAIGGKRNFSTLEISLICEALAISPLLLLDGGEAPPDPAAENVARVRWMAELDVLLTSVGYPPSHEHRYPSTLLDRAVEAWLGGHISIRPIAGLIGADAEDLLDGLPQPHPAR
jgi:transcriptional regulator with XRE-family HTH domain